METRTICNGRTNYPYTRPYTYLIQSSETGQCPGTESCSLGTILNNNLMFLLELDGFTFDRDRHNCAQMADRCAWLTVLVGTCFGGSVAGSMKGKGI